ncbi:MAG: YdiU family protein [Flavobacterium sp.]|nr:YdiU family protein [Flavobacterium sp.]
MNFKLNNRFTTELPTDPEEKNFVRIVLKSCFSYVAPVIPKKPKLIHVSPDVLKLIGLNEEIAQSDEFLSVFSGKKIQPQTRPFAMNYAGHQFGNWAGQLGDGRAINLFEIDHNNNHFTLQLKGAGKTPYSRRGDGLAVLRSSIREHLCSEAMHYLGVPTSRSLSLVLSGDEVLRDMLYDGNAEYEKGAIVCRVAPTFIRFGSFELLAAQNDIENLKLLADFTIEHYFPEITETGKERYLQFFQTVAKKTCEMILHWQRVGFVHGVMNTDNMSIHGITIDYGPYGWLEDYNLNWTPNTTDNQYKRYAFGNQPEIALWNLYQLANALFPLIEETVGLETILNTYVSNYQTKYEEMMRSKIGLHLTLKEDIKLISDLEKTLQLSETDMTIFYRDLCNVKKEASAGCAFSTISNAFYHSDEVNKKFAKDWGKWFKLYLDRLQKEMLSDEERKIAMNKVNPKYVLRNYMAQLAIDAANKDDYSILNELFQMLQKPYDDQLEYEKWFAKRPDWAREKVGCSMLSCSS